MARAYLMYFWSCSVENSGSMARSLFWCTLTMWRATLSSCTALRGIHHDVHQVETRQDGRGQGHVVLQAKRRGEGERGERAGQEGSRETGVCCIVQCIRQEGSSLWLSAVLRLQKLSAVLKLQSAKA